MLKENKYCSNVMKKHFNKELVMSENVEFKTKVLRTFKIFDFERW